MVLALAAHILKTGTIQRLAWPLHKDDTQIREAFHIFKIIIIKTFNKGKKNKQKNQTKNKTNKPVYRKKQQPLFVKVMINTKNSKGMNMKM